MKFLSNIDYSVMAGFYLYPVEGCFIDKTCNYSLNSKEKLSQAVEQKGLFVVVFAPENFNLEPVGLKL